MMRFYFKNLKAIIYSLAIIAFIIGCIVPDKTFPKGFFFGFAGSIFLAGILKSIYQMKKASNVEGSETTKLD